MNSRILGALLVALAVALTSADGHYHHYHHRHHRNRGHRRPEYQWIDLTYALNNQTVLYPGKKMVFGTEFEGFMANGDWLATRGFCISEHTSTHIDAPYHFNKNGKTLTELPLEDMLDVPGVCVDVYDKVHKFEDGQLSVVYNYVVTRKDLIEWEAKYGLIPSGSVVLVYTGWSQRWPNAAQYLGIPPERINATDLTTLADPSQPYKFEWDLLAGDISVNYPGFDASAAQFLSTERHVNGVGIDSLSLDAGTSKDFIAHKIFTKNSVYMIENVANLHLLPASGFQIFAVPFKVDKATGAPTRVLAKLPARLPGNAVNSMEDV